MTGEASGHTDDQLTNLSDDIQIEEGQPSRFAIQKTKKSFLLLIMLIALIGISVGAVTVSLYMEQHEWNTGRTCLDCHTEIGTEFSDMIITVPVVEPHETMTCTDCHQVGSEYTEEHGAVVPRCSDCHTTVPTNMTYDTEAHKQLYVNAVASVYSKGGNEACVVCHTGRDVNATFERPDYYNFTIDSSYLITNVEASSTTHQNTYDWVKTGDLHTYIAPVDVNCGDGGSGCHNDIIAARPGGPGVPSGGHHTATQPLNLTHLMGTDCDTCHKSSSEVLNTEYHAAKNITCAYRGLGCHDRGDTLVSANMTTIFNEITTATGMSSQKEGDICWGCHSGYNWLDPGGAGITIQVWTEPDSTVNVWNDTTAAFEQVYPRAVTGCYDCHDDTGTNPVPFGSGKYINHLNESVTNYDYTNCENCHDTATEPWYPHDIPHDISIDWAAYATAADTNVDNNFCDVVCHYSNLDSRPAYQDASTPWMQDIFNSFTVDGGLHRTSNLIDALAPVECVDCHPNHLQKPDDSDDAATEFQLYGAGSVQGCGDQDLGVGGCHLVNNNTADATDARETPLSHGDSISWNAAGRNDCTQSGCHDKHNYPLDPSEGHNPSPGSCHGVAGSCAPNTNSHPKHINATWSVPEYAYNCSQCHFNDAGNKDGWYDITYGTPEHNDGTVQVRFNGTSPFPTIAIANYSGALNPVYNTTGNMECDSVYCHSDGFGPGFIPGEQPDWNNPAIVCGDCHLTQPTTQAHQIHLGNNMPNANPEYNFECSECHYVSGNSGAGSGVYDTTYGTPQHVDGQIQVNFNTTVGNSYASFDGVLPPGTWDAGTQTCNGVYCHSNGYDIGGAGDQFYKTPAWNTGTINCGDCHGAPNYNNGTAWRELGDTVTGNSASHLKHTRNFGGIYASRNLAWFDGSGGTQSYPDAGEAILQDDGDFLLDPGFLNVAPDILIVDGDARLTDFVAGDDIFWNDINLNNEWDAGEDIWYDAQGTGASYDPGNFGNAAVDWRLYNGGVDDGSIGTGDDKNLVNENGQSIMYLNSDRDDGYYSFLLDSSNEGDNYPGQYGPDRFYSGTEEPLINVGATNLATGANLLSTHEVLQPYQGNLNIYPIGFWFDDMQAWYNYDCSECHYNTPPTAGLGTYGTNLHVDKLTEVYTATDPTSLSTYFGTYTPQYLPGTMECGVVYCHSDGFFYDTNGGAGNDDNPDFSGPNAAHAEDDTNFRETYPDWDNSASVSCGDAGNTCHGAGDEDSTMPDANYPNTGGHQDARHQDVDQTNIRWKGSVNEVWCSSCHFDEDNGPYYYYHPYGMPTHVDGSIMMDNTQINPWLNPIVGRRGDACHNDKWDYRNNGYVNLGAGC